MKSLQIIQLQKQIADKLKQANIQYSACDKALLDSLLSHSLTSVEKSPRVLH